MKSSAKNISLSSYDDIFKTDESVAETGREKVTEIALTELHPFKNHPFKVLDDDRMADTAESIKEYGVLVPAIARPRVDGGYELIAGHRRKRGCEPDLKQCRSLSEIWMTMRQRLSWLTATFSVKTSYRVNVLLPTN